MRSSVKARVSTVKCSNPENLRAAKYSNPDILRDVQSHYLQRYHARPFTQAGPPSSVLVGTDAALLCYLSFAALHPPADAHQLHARHMLRSRVSVHARLGAH
eukprot:3915834-Pleurochrysis_carterae.AAC.2